MASDMQYIASFDEIRAAKYVLVSGLSVLIAFISTLIGVSYMMRMGIGGPAPYYVKRSNLYLAPLVVVIFAYFFLFNQSVARSNASIARAIFQSDWCLFFSASGIGLVGTAIVRLAVIIWRRLRDGNDFPASE